MRKPVLTDDGNWVYTPAFALQADTLISISPSSPLSAVDIYRTIPIEDLPADSLDDEGIPDWAHENKIRITDIRTNPNIYFAVVTQQLVLSLSDSLSYSSDRIEDFNLRKQWFEATWKVWFTTINSVGRMKCGVQKGGGDSLVYSVYDAFIQYTQIMKDSNRNRIKQRIGFKGAFGAFKNLRSMAKAIESEFPGIGCQFISWMMVDGLDLTGWQSWSQDDFNSHLQSIGIGDRHRFQAFYDRKNYPAAVQFMNKIGMILAIGKDTEHVEIQKGETLENPYDFSSKRFRSVLNSFYSAYSMDTRGEVLTHKKVDSLLYWGANTDFSNIREGDTRTWTNFPLTTATSIELITKTMISLHHTDQIITNPDLFNSPSLLTIGGFNDWMAYKTSQFTETWTWNPLQDRVQLSDFSDLSAYIGARSPDNRYLIPSKSGEFPIWLDSEFEAQMSYNTYNVRMFDSSVVEIPLGSTISPFHSLQGREIIRNWDASIIPTRTRSLDFDDAGESPTKKCYWDFTAIFKDGRGLAVECLGDNGRAYKLRHSADGRQFMDDRVPIVHIVSQVEKMAYFDGFDNFYHTKAPLFSRPMWAAFGKVLFYYELWSATGSTPDLSLQQILFDAYLHPERYGLDDYMAILLLDAFGINSDGSIKDNMLEWWEIFTNSNDPKYSEKFFKLRNMADRFIDGFWL